MYNIEYKTRLGVAISENPEPLFSKLFPETTIVPLGENYRLQPCPNPKCGHLDCCNITIGSPKINCFHPGCSVHGYTVDCLASLLGDRASEIYSVAAEGYGIEVPNDRLSRLQNIKHIAAEHYHCELMNSSAPLTYQREVRMHSVETLELFKVGLVSNLGTLLQKLREMGFSEEEIDEAKIRITDGLFVYPYYDIKTGNIVRFNTKGILYESGDKPKGFSIGPKACYTTPTISKDKVIIVEGENDSISLYEAGETSVIALGGNSGKIQLEALADMVDDVALVYLMFDNDDAGNKYIEEVNTVLPNKMVYLVSYEGNDPDDLLKRSEFTGSMEGLLQSAKLLPSDGYTFRRHHQSWSMLTRDFSIKFTVKGQDSNGVFNGDIEFYIGAVLTDHKVNCKISSYRHKEIQAHYVFQFHKELEAFYSGHNTDMDLTDLLDCYEFSSRQSNIVKRIAEAIYKSEDKEHEIGEVSKRLNTTARDSVLGELNELDNATLSTHDGIPKVKISQFFSIKNGEAYFYFNKVVNDGEGTVRLPYLLSNKREQIRLDLIKRKNSQNMLLLNKKYELPFEVSNAITEYQETSLQQGWVDMYVADKIPKEELQPEKVIRTLEKQVQRFFFSSDAKIYKILALWIFGTYLYELFGEYPYLYLTGNKGTGKSTLDNVIYSYGFNAKFAVKITEAAMGRLITAEGGTLIMDELENLTSRSKSQEYGISGLLKGGYSKSTGRDYKTNMDKGIVEGFTVYGPKVISNIFGLDDVLHDRVIEIQMQPASVDIVTSLEKIEQHREHNFEEIHEITSRCCLSVLENFQSIYEKYESYSFSGETARMSQILKPILSLASIAGEDFVEAVEWYYNERLLPAKVEVEESSPESLVKNILGEVALELLGRESFGWIKQLSQDDSRVRSWVIQYPDGFRANQLFIKVALDSLSQGIKYPYNQILKYIKRVFGKVEFDRFKRTTITLYPDEALAKEVNSDRPTASNYRFYYKDFGLKDWDKPVSTKEPDTPTESLQVSLFEVIEANKIVSEAPVDYGGF